MTCNQVSQLTLPVALPGILQSMDNADVVAILPGVGTAFFALGKLSVVVATHHLGPTLVLTGACFLSGAGLLLFALGSWSLQIIGWSTVSYAVAHMWGSSARVIANWVDDEHRGRAYGFSFGLATDGGSALASFVYGATLSRTGAEGWRFLFLGAGAYTLAVAALVARTVRGSAQEAGHRPPLGAAVRHVGGGWRQEDAHPLAHATLPEALGVFLRSGRVMLACCATSGFACTAGTLQIYGPLYAVRVVGASPAEGAFVVSAFALGALLGSLLGGYMLDAMRPLPFVVASVGLKLLGVVAAAVWLVLDSYSAMTLPALAAVCFTIMWALEHSWNPALSCFSARYGGPHHVATVIGLQDACAFSARIPFTFAVGHLMATAEYHAVLRLLFGAVLVGNLLMSVLFFADLRCPSLPQAQRAERTDAGLLL